MLIGCWTPIGSTAIHLANAERKRGATLDRLGKGWAANSINTASFRRDSVTSRMRPDGSTVQYAAYYDGDGRVVIEKRGRASHSAPWSDWTAETLPQQADTGDAHNALSLGVDGKGYLHVAWSDHAGRLTYLRSTKPDSLEMGTEPVVGSLENQVTYPQFFQIPEGAGGDAGGLFFLYREGSSGNGDAVLDRYDLEEGMWTRVSSRLLAGTGARNAYWQGAVDSDGRLHLSWTWRETSDVATNHDIGYAHSTDSTGQIWEDASGTTYGGEGAEPSIDSADMSAYAALVPQGSALMNQTSMTVDDAGRPYIASYWRAPEDGADAGMGGGPSLAPGEVVQYHVLTLARGSSTGCVAGAGRCAEGAGANASADSSSYGVCSGWTDVGPELRTSDFTLGGRGTQAVPVARPLIVMSRGSRTLGLVIRDGDVASQAVALATAPVGSDGVVGRWSARQLTKESVGQWEPSGDSALMRDSGELALFVQRVGQADDEGLTGLKPQPAYVLTTRLETTLQ